MDLKTLQPLSQTNARPSQAEAEEAIRTLIAYTGDDPNREGLLDTPSRVARAYKELFKGYDLSPDDDLARTFEEVEGYQDIVLLKDIPFQSHCEHHMMPFIGKAHVAYMPQSRVVGISKLARVVDIYARRLQSQETMTMEIAQAIHRALEPKGVAVIISAEHFCMSMRGVKKQGVMTVTRHFMGQFQDEFTLRQNLQSML